MGKILLIGIFNIFEWTGICVYLANINLNFENKISSIC